MTLLQIIGGVLAVIFLIGGILWFRSTRNQNNLAFNQGNGAVPNINLRNSPTPNLTPTPEGYPAASPVVSPQSTNNLFPTPTATSSAYRASGLAALPSTGVSTQGNVVNIHNTGFSPKEIVIKEGEEVIWINADTINHQISAAPVPSVTFLEAFDTVGLIKPKTKKELFFTTKGTYRYRDALHPQYTGLVTVE